MENEWASRKSERRGDQALYAVYAPPRTAHVPLPALPGQWSARAMLAAAFRDQRRVPLRALLLLGLLPGLWCLPANVLIREFSIENLTLDWRLQSKEAGYNLLHSLWVSVPAGGQTLLSLDIARAGTGASRRFPEGFRFTPAFFVVAAVTSVLIQLMMAPTSASEDEFDVLTSIAVMLVLAAPVVCALFVYALVGYPLVERRWGLIDALRQVWELLSRSLWRYVRLALLSVFLYAPGFLIAMVAPVYGASVFWALLAPTVHLAWAHAYLRSSAALEPGSAAGSGPSVAA